MDICAWCKRLMPGGRRTDARTCSKSCRQAQWRFARYVSPPARATLGPERPMRFAYADPPYIGKAFYYPEKREVSYAALVPRLVSAYPDGWALSLSARSLPFVLSLCPTDVRVAAWFRGARITRSHSALTAWEPVILRGGRPSVAPGSARRFDALIAEGKFRAYPGRVIGMKPPAFAAWVFELLGVAPGDRLDDLFPGSGAVGRAFALYTSPVHARRLTGRHM